MTFFIKNGSKFNVSATGAVDLHDELPVGTYTVKFERMGEYYYLEQVDNFKIKGKIYGDALRQRDRILRTFNERSKSTGVMLSGEKGSGKTLLAELLSLEAQKSGIPTIVINEPWSGDEFNRFVQSIDQPTVVIFDEFEKVYDREKQEQMLTLLDGVYSSKKLFILTCNDKWRINEHMKNRPGRIYYRLDYRGLDSQFIREYCEDNLVNITYIESVMRIAAVFGEFNFDILKAMVEEMNRYDESPQEVMKMLNAKPENDEARIYNVALEMDGLLVPSAWLGSETWRGNPLGDTVNVYYERDTDTDDDDLNTARFQVGDLVAIDGETGEFHFLNSKKEKLKLSRVVTKTYNYDAV